MTKRGRLLLYGSMLTVGLIAFILEIFVFQKPDGVIGLLICIASILMIFTSTVKLCRMSEKFKNGFFEVLDIFLFLP